MPDEKKSPLDSLLELALYAPLGLALAARDHLPELVARGRQQVSSQVALARMMGKYAVAQGEKDLRKKAGDVTETLSGLGLIPDPNPPTSTSTTPTPPPEVVVDAPAASNGKAETRSRADLSIPGYDTLSASQVVQRLAGLAPEELEAVKDYESGTRGRRTILSKIAQLQSGPAV